MTLRGAAAGAGARWERFFYGLRGVDGRVLALLRVGFSVLILVHVAALFPDVGMLWSERGVLPLAALGAVAGGSPPTLLAPLSGWEAAPYVAFALLGVHALLLGVGYRTRLQALFVLAWLVSFQNRNPLVTNGQDALLRVTAVLMVLLPCGAAWSVDARRRARGMATTGTYAATVEPSSLWPLRLFQLQVSFVMLSAALWKVLGDDWTQGTALHYVTRLQGLWGNGPIPRAFMGSPGLLSGATLLTLGVELVLPLVIWVPSLRRAALLVAFGFHLALAYAMNLFLFPWIMILGWCSFVRASDLELVHGTFSLGRLRAVRFPPFITQRIRS